MTSYNTVDKAFFLLIGTMLFIFVYIMALSVGALGSDDLYGFGRVLLVMEVLITVYLIININRFKNPPKLVLLVLVWTIWVLVTNINFLIPFNKNLLILNTLEVILWTSFFLFFFIYIKNNSNKLKKVTILFYCLLLFSTYMFFKIYTVSNLLSGKSNALINFSYYPLLLLPWILLVKAKYVRYLGVALIGIVVLASLKRTALICFLLSVTVNGFINSYFKNTISKTILTVFCISVPLIFYVPYFYSSYDEIQIFTRFSEILDDGGSGRKEIWSDVINLLINTNWYDWLIGHGHNTVMAYSESGLSAHNDWLEVAFDYGFYGLLLYIILNITLIRKSFLLFNTKSTFTGPFVASYVIFFTMSLSSHLILYPTYFIFIASFWGSITAITGTDYEYENKI